MSLVFQNIVASDTIDQIVEKLNKNFNQIKINGGGESGIPGKDSFVRGIPGIRGTTWYSGSDNPNTLIFSNLIENDLYLQSNGDVWECINPDITTKWELVYVGNSVVLNIKGAKGDTGDTINLEPSIFEKKDLYISSNQFHHFYYVPSEDIANTLTDIRPIVLGGHVDGGEFTLPDNLLNGIHGENGILFLYNPIGASGGKQLKFLSSETKNVLDAPEIYTDLNDTLVIKNNRLISDFNYDFLDGINLETFDTDISIKSGRNINISTDNLLNTMDNNDSVKNIIISTTDYANTDINYNNSGILSLRNIYDGVNKYTGNIDIFSDNKTSVKKVGLFSSKIVSLTETIVSLILDVDSGLKITLPQSKYFSINNTANINNISTLNTLGGLSSSDNIISTQKAVKTYVDSKISDNNSLLTNHIETIGVNYVTSNLHPHQTYLNQTVRTDSSPRFNKIYIDSTENYIDVSDLSSLLLKSGNNKLIIGIPNNETILEINGDLVSSVTYPSKFIFKNSSLYADVEVKSLITHDNIEINNNWINSNSTNSINFKNGNIGIKTLAVDNYSLKVSGDVFFGNSIYTELIYLGNNTLIENNDIYFRLKLNENVILNSTENLYINKLNITGETTPTNIYWNNGENNYINFEIGKLTINDSIITNGNWISFNESLNNGIHINSLNNIGINIENIDNLYTVLINGTLSASDVNFTTLSVNSISNLLGDVTIGTQLVNKNLTVNGSISISNNFILGSNTISEISTDTTLLDNSNTKLSTQKAIKTYIDNINNQHVFSYHKLLSAGNGIILTGGYNGMSEKTITLDYGSSGTSNKVSRDNHTHDIYALHRVGEAQNIIDNARFVYDNITAAWVEPVDLKITKLWTKDVGNGFYITNKLASTFDGNRWIIESNNANTKCYVYSAENAYKLRDRAPSVTAGDANTLVLRASTGEINTTFLNMSASTEITQPTKLAGIWENNILKYVTPANITVGKATILENTRTINGVNFNGSSNINISDLRGNNYVAGLEKPNNAVFGSGKLRYQMLSGANIASGVNWNDVLWISSYTGGDYKGSNVLVFGKTEDYIGFARQNYDSASWGYVNEILHFGNYMDFTVTKTGTGASGNWGIDITGTSVNTTKVNNNNFNFNSISSSKASWLLGGFDSFSNGSIDYGNIYMVDPSLLVVKTATRTDGFGTHEHVQNWDYYETAAPVIINTDFSKMLFITTGNFVCRIVGWVKWKQANGTAYYEFVNFTPANGINNINSTILGGSDPDIQVKMYFYKTSNALELYLHRGVNSGFTGNIDWGFTGTVYIIKT